MNIKILYHGSNIEVKNPKLDMNVRPLDFGKGFYTTENYEQAKAWAIKRADRFGDKPIISKYEIDLDKLNIKEFKLTGKEWLEFVCSSRKDINLTYANNCDAIYRTSSR